MKNWKRNAIIAGVLVLVCAGIYLNWLSGQDTKDLNKVLDADKILGGSTLVLNDTTPSKEALAAQETGQSASEYFAQMRLSRQKARDQAVELLQETIAYAEGEDTSKSSAALEGIVGDALAESQIESLVVAKGYADCVAFMGAESISVVVDDADGLDATDVARIMDIVVQETGYSPNQIKVLESD